MTVGVLPPLKMMITLTALDQESLARVVDQDHLDLDQASPERAVDPLDPDLASPERAVDPHHLHPLATITTTVTGFGCHLRPLLLPLASLERVEDPAASPERVVDPAASLARAADRAPHLLPHPAGTDLSGDPLPPATGPLLPGIAPQAAVASQERAVDLDLPDLASLARAVDPLDPEVESLERVVDPDHLHPLAMTALVTGDHLLPGHLAQAAPAVASLERVVDPVESLERVVDPVESLARAADQAPHLTPPPAGTDPVGDLPPVTGLLPHGIAPQAAVESLARVVDLDLASLARVVDLDPLDLEVESLARVVDLDLLQPAPMTIGDPPLPTFLPGHLAAAAPAVASLARVVDPVESLARVVDLRDPREVPQAVAQAIMSG